MEAYLGQIKTFPHPVVIYSMTPLDLQNLKLSPKRFFSFAILAALAWAELCDPIGVHTLRIVWGRENLLYKV